MGAGIGGEGRYGEGSNSRIGLQPPVEMTTHGLPVPSPCETGNH